MKSFRLERDFYSRDVLEVAPELLGQTIIHKNDNGELMRYTISEVEAYKGNDDLACHASKGRTPRTETMFAQGGTIYVYLIYGMHWMMNIVTGSVDDPQAILIRGLQGCKGPGRLTKMLGVNKEYNGEDLCKSERIWLDYTPTRLIEVKSGPRIGIDYAGPYWANMPWRFWVDL